MSVHRCTHLLLVVLMLIIFLSETWSEPVNVALGKEVIANYTCGTFGMETYNTLEEAHMSLTSRVKKTCSALNHGSDTEPTFPEGAMVDGDIETWWQSASRSKIYLYGRGLIDLTVEKQRKLEAVITIDLQQQFLAEEIIIRLGNALTPQKIAILKSWDGQSYQEWIYGVTSLDQCNDVFGKSETNRLPSTIDGTVCHFYEADDQVPGDTITFDLTNVPDNLQEWKRIQYLQVKFYDMLFIFPFNQLANTFNHYAIREFIVMAECPCNGQESACVQNPTTNIFECVCGGNTEGTNCESCMDKFNQFKFEEGIACKECNCFNHAESCFYSAPVEERRESIDIDGNRLGGGVCLNCQHNTAGVNCEKCVNLYYRPQGRDRTANNVCVPCGCSADGSAVNPDTGLTDCVMNDDEARSDGKVPGDCFCKLHVEGTKCNLCKSGYYNLDSSHDAGCIECFCYTPGTIDASTMCIIDATGQCDCKPNVQGRACDECKDGFFGLTADDVNGCEPCDCNVGGSVNQICNKITGQCVCRSDNIIGRICNVVDIGYYYPSPHAIHEELEDSFGVLNVKSENQYSGFSDKGYVVASEQVTVSVLMSIPGNRKPSEQYIMIVRYRTPNDETADAIVVITTQSADTTPVSLTLPVCTASWCQVDSGAASPFTLKSFPILISITVNTGNVLLDQLIAMPVEYTTVETLLSITLPAGCSFLQNIMPTVEEDADICRNALFTVTMRYWESPLPCECDVTGSLTNVCDPNGGQCVCHNGVMGRSCDSCSSGHYGFTLEGCSECNCDGASSSCNEATGQCQCPDNTLGRQCELCLPNHWGWDRVTGCQECGCHELGTAFPQCNEETGICKCKPGVQGGKCDECQDNFYNLRSSGCSSCACDMRGSVNPKCNQTTGDCECKENSIGRQCNECKEATFGLHTTNVRGCLECICMGITTNCSAANVKINMDFYALTTTTEDGSQPRLVLATEDGSPSTTPVNIEGNENGQTYTLTVNLDNNAIPHFWAMPSELISNILDLYGSTVTVEVTVVVVGDQLSSNLQAIILTSDDIKLTSNFGPVQSGFNAEVVITLRESEWQQEGATGDLTRATFLKALSKVSHFLLPTTFSSATHTARISSLKFGVVGDTGVETLTVENCVCGEAYSGRSCQNCADGYKRANQDSSEFFGVCVPCECNGHSSLCDEDTGACINCQHSTVGSSCEQCADGFYGNALGGTDSDCTSCPCLQPRVANASCYANTSDSNDIICRFCNDGYEGNLCDQCSTSYFGNPQEVGGTCSPCQCNGNADSCDSVTGICVDCSSNTVGNNCERCADNFYGNASSQSCTVCGCVETASESPICDSTSGQCTCHPGVGGRTCDQCIEGYWGYNNADFQGCQICQCLLAGSQQVQCNADTGQCTCNDNTEGDLCDTCSVNFFGLPEKPCEACACNAVGTVPDTQCNNVTGQCTCQPGVTGRQCDQCLPLYIGFSSQGCTECDTCQTALGDSMEILIDTTSQYLQNTQTVSEVQSEDSRLQILEEGLQDSLEQLGLSETDATSIADVTSNITNLLTTLSAKFQNTNTMINTLQTESSDLRTRSSNKATEETTMSDNATALVTSLTNFETTVNSHLENLNRYNRSASELSERGNQVTSVTIDLTGQTAAVNKLLEDVQDIGEINTTIATIEEQETNCIAQLNAIETLTTNFDQIAVTVDNLISNHSKVSFNVAVVDNTLDRALVFKSQAEELLASVGSVLTNAENRNIELASSLTSAQVGLRRTRSIYNGDATSIISGEDAIPFPSGVTNYETGISNLNGQLDANNAFAISVNETVSSAEEHVNRLQTQFDAVNSTYLNLPDIGREAKDAIDNYNQVILDLNNSVVMANTARDLIADVQQDVSGDSLEERRTLYNNETTRMEALRDEMQALDLEPQVLENEIEAAQDKLSKEINDWVNLDMKLANMTTEANALSEQHQDNTLLQAIEEAVAKVQAAETTTNNIAIRIEGQSQGLDAREIELNTTKNQIEETRNLDTVVRDQLNKHQTDFGAFLSNVTRAEDETTEFQTTATTISDKIAALEEKLARAESLLSQLQQPITFDGSLSIEVNNPKVNNPQVNDSQTHDYISLNVKKAAGFADGNIFFTENSQTAEELEIGLAESKVFFEFNTGAEMIRITNPIEICDDCWAEVQASRIGNIGYISVTNLDTGAVTALDSSGQQPSTSSSITLTTPLYVGSLPQDTTITKVVNKNFQGCLSGIQYQNQAINLWLAAVASNQEPGCCQAPPSGPVTPTTSGASFSGFGFLVLEPPVVSLPTFESLNLHFRTFSSEGSLFLTSTPDSQAKFDVGLNNGVVYWGLELNGDRSEVRTVNTYNTGQWVMVSAVLTGNLMQLSVTITGESSPSEVIDLPGVDVSDLSPLENQPLFIGAPTNPFNAGVSLEDATASLLANVNDNYFFGCLRNIDLDISGSAPAVRLSMTENVVIQSGVNPNGCPENVINGVNFLTSSSFIKLPGGTAIEQVSSLEMKLVTRETQAVLLYITTSGPPMRSLYVALFGGNVMVHYSQEASAMLISTGKFISDGNEHTIMIDTSTSRISLYVDGSVFEEASSTLSTQHLSFQSNTESNTELYLGGVRDNSTLSSRPVSVSLIGGITSLRLNGNSVTLTQSFFEEYKDVSLEGVVSSGSSSPTPNACATTIPPTLLSNGVLFDGTRTVDWTTTAGEIAPSLLSGLTMTFEFSLFKANGVLFYASDSVVSPNQYLIVYFLDGFINVNIKTSLGEERAITTINRYLHNDAPTQHSISIVRMNDLVTLSVDTGTEVINTGQDPETVSTLEIPLNLGIWLGGIGINELQTLPLPAPLTSQIQETYFGGALFSASIDDGTTVTTLNFGQLDSGQFPGVPANIVYGVSLSGQSSYLRLEQQTTLPNQELVISMEISTTTQSALLFVLYESASKFIAVSYDQNKIQLHLTPSFNGFTEVLSLTTFTFPGTSVLCDGNAHSLSFTFQSNALTTTIDAVSIDSNIPVSHAVQSMTNAGFYVGGITADDASSIPDTVIKSSLAGCIETVSVITNGNVNTYDPTAFGSISAGLSYGCPQ